ncbi:MAG TPA: hypothetical protein VK573_00335 [Gemmatimonadales bacterium]|nr:hypothetical protein [Gemmatimonadales bacterium]
MRRWGLAAGGAALLAAVLTGGLTASQGERRWVALDGRDWSQFAPREKRAYVAGFLAGVGLADGEQKGGASPDTAAVRRAVDSLYRVGGLRFPFGHMVYATQLDEFYWWDNHVPTPLYLALRDINGRLKRQDD